jgi:hypothetical protein
VLGARFLFSIVFAVSSIACRAQTILGSCATAAVQAATAQRQLDQITNQEMLREVRRAALRSAGPCSAPGQCCRSHVIACTSHGCMSSAVRSACCVVVHVWFLVHAGPPPHVVCRCVSGFRRDAVCATVQELADAKARLDRAEKALEHSAEMKANFGESERRLQVGCATWNAQRATQHAT